MLKFINNYILFIKMKLNFDHQSKFKLKVIKL
jgi:hypothetical protein